MLAAFPVWLRAVLSILLLVINTVVCGAAVILLVPFKWIISQRGWRKFWTKLMISIGSLYILNNKGILKLVHRTSWNISGIEDLHLDRQYLVLANHQSAVDIPVLQGVFLGHIPFLRFFIKQQLLWVPFLGLALWALDMPVMKRYTKKKLKQRPDLRTHDLERTQIACERLRDQPLTLLNFAEGTRYSSKKHREQNPPFQRLLRPKSGGVHAVLSALGDQLDSILDVTIVYPGLISPTLGDMAFGKVPCIQVQVDRLQIGVNGVPTLEVIRGRKGQLAIREWMNERWILKDSLLSEIQKDSLSELPLGRNPTAIV